MVSSRWRTTWQQDFDRILYSMDKRQRVSLQRWGLLSVQGRRVFMEAADRLEVERVYASYVIEQAALAMNPAANSPCAVCGTYVDSLNRGSVHLTFWPRGWHDAGDFADLHFCSDDCVRQGAGQFAESGSWPHPS